jgi:asparagine synthase (glutamine-hydrolysing)
LWHQDEPFYAPNLFLNWEIDRCAQEQGVSVILNGYGGDAVVSYGTAFLAELACQGRWISLAQEISWLSRNYRRPALNILKSKVLSPLMPLTIRRLLRLMRGRTRSWNCVNSMVKPEFARSVGLEEREERSRAIWAAPVRTARQDHWRHLTWGYYTFGLEIMDRVAAAHSVEVRYPFYDLRAVELCLALPPEQKLCNGWTRMIIRRALAGTLPEAISWRSKKASLAPNFFRGFALYEREKMEQVVLKKCHLIERYVDIHVLQQAYERFITRKSTEDGHNVWLAVTLGLWLDQAQVE